MSFALHPGTFESTEFSITTEHCSSTLGAQNHSMPKGLDLYVYVYSRYLGTCTDVGCDCIQSDVGLCERILYGCVQPLERSRRPRRPPAHSEGGGAAARRRGLVAVRVRLISEPADDRATAA